MAEVSANMNITQAAVPFAGQSSVLEAKKLEAPAQVMVSGKDSVQPASVEELKAQVSELKALIEKTARTPAGKSRGFLADLREFAANHPAVAGVVSGLTGGLAGVAIGEIRNNRELRKQLKEMETHLEEAGISKKTPLSPQPESPAIPPSKGKTLLEKEEAMNLLLDAEKGDAQGAGADFSLVAKSAGHGGETLREAAEQFARLLEVEGCSQTTKAQEDYALIDGTLKPGQKRAEAVTQFLRLADAENDTSQARGDFALLQRNLPSGTTLTRATSQFLSLLNCEGAENTVDVQADFRTIQQSLKEGETWEAAFEQFRRLYDMELNRSFALEDFAVISETLKKGESRKMATDQFIRLYDAEQSRRDAISDYRLIRRVAGQDSLEEGTTRFLKLLNKAGSDNTAAVQGSFNLLYQ